MATIIDPSIPNLKQVACQLLNHNVAAFPTETVYGLGAIANSSEGILKIYHYKKRPLFNPLILHFSSLEQVQLYFTLNSTQLLLAKHFWPGALTLILTNPTKLGKQICKTSLGKATSYAARVVQNPIAQKLIELVNFPLAAPSANQFNHISPTLAQHVESSFPLNNFLIIDGGATVLGLESTIVKATANNTVTILRPGSITNTSLAKYVKVEQTISSQEVITAPGMLKKHYSPSIQLHINATTATSQQAVLAFGQLSSEEQASFGKAAIILNLSPQGDLSEAAHNLYAMLWQLDNPKYTSIAVMPIPNSGLGATINERLLKASSKN